MVAARLHDAEDADGRAPQAEGVGGAGGLLAHADDADQLVQPVGEADERAQVAARHLLRGAEGLVVVLDGVGDLGVEPLQPRVVAAHDALQLGELAHHAGAEVGLAEPRRLDAASGDESLLAERAAPARSRRAPIRCDPLELAAELRLVGAPAQVLDPVAERPLAVLLEEEAGVGEPGPQHALVAVARHLGVLHRRAGDGDEAGS